MGLAEKLIELVDVIEAKTITIATSKGMKDAEVIKYSKKVNLAVVLVADAAESGKFAVAVAKGKKFFSLFSTAKELEVQHKKFFQRKAKTLKSLNFPSDDKTPEIELSKYSMQKGLSFVYSDKTSAETEVGELKKLFPKNDFEVIPEITSKEFSITHPETGYKIFSIKTKSNAVKALKEIENEGIVFGKEADPKKLNLSEEDKTFLTKLYMKYKGK